MGVVLYAQKYTEIKGFVKNDRLKEVHLYRVEDGTTHSYASTMVAEDGSYGFLFCPEKCNSGPILRSSHNLSNLRK